MLSLRDELSQLAWVLELAQADIGGWRAGDWLNALDDTIRVVGGSLGGPSIRSWLEIASTGSPPDQAERLVKRAQVDLAPFVKSLAQALNDRADGYVAGIVAFGGDCRLIRFPEVGQLRLVFLPNGADPGERLARMLLRRVADLLTRVDLQRLRRCPECHRLFVAVRHQRFDTPQCSSRDRVQRFRRKQRKARGSAPALGGTRPQSRRRPATRA